MNWVPLHESYITSNIVVILPTDILSLQHKWRCWNFLLPSLPSDSSFSGSQSLFRCYDSLKLELWTFAIILPPGGRKRMCWHNRHSYSCATAGCAVMALHKQQRESVLYIFSDRESQLGYCFSPWRWSGKQRSMFWIRALGWWSCIRPLEKVVEDDCCCHQLIHVLWA